MAGKKNFRSVASALAPVAAGLPSQHVEPRPSDHVGQGAAPLVTAPSNTDVEPLVQFSFALRKSLRKELARLADDADMTMRAFILEALREKGLSVTEEDLLDLRRPQSREPSTR